MNKKAIIIGMVTLMLVMTTHLNVLSEQIKKDDSILSSNENMDVLAEKDNSVNEDANTDDLHRSVFSNSDITFRSGWIKVNSTGKGLHLIIPLKLLKINAPIPTIQYHNFFPFKIDMFVTLLVYNDTKAITNITYFNWTTKNFSYHNISGNHSLLLGMFKIPSMNLLKQLLIGGVIDGIQPVQHFAKGLGLVNLTPAGILRGIVGRINNRIFGKPDPIINITKKETKDFLRALNGVPPRYQNYDIPILNGTRINRWRDWFEENFPGMSNRLINKTLRYLVILLPGYFWNRMPIRTSFLHLEMPQQLLGYTPFVVCGKTQRLEKIVGKIQNLIPDIFYDGRG